MSQCVNIPPLSPSFPSSSQAIDSSRSRACRRLMFDSADDSSSTSESESRVSNVQDRLKQVLHADRQRMADTWDFDSVTGLPLNSDASVLVWTMSSGSDVPEFYCRPVHSKPGRPSVPSTPRKSRKRRQPSAPANLHRVKLARVDSQDVTPVKKGSSAPVSPMPKDEIKSMPSL